MNDIGIYRFQNLITLESYVGQSIQLQERYNHHKREWVSGTTKFYKAIQQFGWENFSYEILEYCSAEELNEKERYWIDYFDSYKNGYNHNVGGSNKNSIDRKKVYELWDQGKTIKEIIEILQISQTSAYTILNAYEPFICRETPQPLTIYQYDLQGNFIQSWTSQKEIQRVLQIDASAIGKVLSGQRKTAGGYIWTNVFQDKINEINPNKTSIPKPIIKYSLSNEYVCKYNSIAEAARSVSGDSSAIRRAAQRHTVAYGYRWRFIE